MFSLLLSHATCCALPTHTVPPPLLLLLLFLLHRLLSFFVSLLPPRLPPPLPLLRFSSSFLFLHRFLFFVHLPSSFLLVILHHPFLFSFFFFLFESLDDTAFEKQSALFALAISDIVLINMWCHDIGREQAANKPLLKTVFQTPLEHLEPVLREDIRKIWDNVPKPQAHKETPLSEFFNVEVVALSSFEEKEVLFREQVASLRQRFYHSIAPGGLAGDRRGVVPASGFSFSAQQIWMVIKENKDLDLPAHKVMVATVRCEEIANEKLAYTSADKEWVQLEEAVQHDLVPGFGKKITAILDKCLAGYDMEAFYFEEAVRTSKRQQLESKLLQLVSPAYQTMLGHIRSKVLDDFKEAFDKALEKKGFAVAALECTQSSMFKFDRCCEDAAIEQANWDPSKIRDKLQRDIDTHLASVRTAKLSELTALFEAREEAGRVLIRMKDRFSTLFSRDADSMPRVWTGKEDIKAITKSARSASLKLLSVMAAIRLDEETDKIEETLSLALVDALSNGAKNRSIQSFDPLASSSWQEVPSAKTLISPVQCKNLWRQFKAETEYTVTQAIAAQACPLTCNFSEANKRNNSMLPPPWAIAAILVLGFNEFMTLLRNPLYLGVIFVVFLVGKAIWVQLDITGEFRNGALPGLLSLSTKFLPTVMNILKRLAEEGQQAAAPPSQSKPELDSKVFRNSIRSNSTSDPSSNISSTEDGDEYSSPLGK
ncbi:hypothetical protein C4D60_Mb04t08460 [Musa balbisiana]|uniref:Sey1/RHD3-like three-helix bundle domain-containing protein n=1 Tax=Musa balbisiana TaxID=52838 RepID=A0A4S8KAM1_MUSBA|nr:hypothetical protein C4D60_Mb04t08460 [Musa balbisiana]